MNDTAVASQTCQKRKKIKVSAEFISEKTGWPMVNCRTCLAPSRQTARNSPDKRKVSPSLKAAENTKIDEEIKERRVSMKVKMGKEKAAWDSVMESLITWEPQAYPGLEFGHRWAKIT